jgi:hypothetical protein
VLLVFRKPQHGKARYNDIQKKRANTRFSGLLTFTYFLCDAFFEWKYRTRCYKSRHSTPITASTMAFSSSPNRPTLGAHQQHSQAALPTLLPVIKCMVCSECAFYFRQGSICNISRNWNTPPKSNSIATLHTAIESCQTHHHLAHAWIACGRRWRGPLFSSE